MRDLVEFLAKSLVDRPEAVRVSEQDDGRSVILTIHVDPDDMGKVIGKQGRIVRAIRTVTKAAAVRSGRRVEVEVES